MKFCHIFSFTQKRPKPQSIPYYIEEVVGYRSKYESSNKIENGYPPVVAELLLSILIDVRVFCRAGSGLIGMLILLVLKALLFS